MLFKKLLSVAVDLRIVSNLTCLFVGHIIWNGVYRHLDVADVAFVKRANCQIVEPVCHARIWWNLEVWDVTNSAVYSAGNLKCPSGW